MRFFPITPDDLLDPKKDWFRPDWSDATIDSMATMGIVRVKPDNQGKNEHYTLTVMTPKGPTEIKLKPEYGQMVFDFLCKDWADYYYPDDDNGNGGRELPIPPESPETLGNFLRQPDTTR